MGCWEWFSDVNSVAREGPSQNGEKGKKLTICLFYNNLITILVQRESAHQTPFEALGRDGGTRQKALLLGAHSYGADISNKQKDMVKFQKVINATRETKQRRGKGTFICPSFLDSSNAY